MRLLALLCIWNPSTDKDSMVCGISRRPRIKSLVEQELDDYHKSLIFQGRQRPVETKKLTLVGQRPEQLGLRSDIETPRCDTIRTSSVKAEP